MIKLTREQFEEAARHPEGVECQLDGTNKLFIIVDAGVHKQMKTAFYQKEVRNSIATGIAEMEANKGLPIEEADQDMRSKLGFPPRTAT